MNIQKGQLVVYDSDTIIVKTIDPSNPFDIKLGITVYDDDSNITNNYNIFSRKDFQRELNRLAIYFHNSTITEEQYDKILGYIKNKKTFRIGVELLNKISEE